MDAGKKADLCKIADGAVIDRCWASARHVFYRLFRLVTTHQSSLSLEARIHSPKFVKTINSNKWGEEGMWVNDCVYVSDSFYVASWWGQRSNRFRIKFY